jgi:hypothetical protein
MVDVADYCIAAEECAKQAALAKTFKDRDYYERMRRKWLGVALARDYRDRPRTAARSSRDAEWPLTGPAADSSERCE